MSHSDCQTTSVTTLVRADDGNADLLDESFDDATSRRARRTDAAQSRKTPSLT